MKMIRHALVLGLVSLLSTAAYSSKATSESWAKVKALAPRDEGEGLFVDAVSDILAGRADVGRTKLEAILVGPPDGWLWKAALLALADSFYLEGGSQNLGQAEATYRKFLLQFPDDQLGDPVRINLADIDLRRLHDNGLHPAEGELKELIRIHPGSPQRKEADERLAEILETLADHEMKLARFYYDQREAPEAARQRTEVILNKYPHYSRFDEALYYHALSVADYDTQTAGHDLSRLIRGYPGSQYSSQAASRLEGWGLPLPQPDPAVGAGQNQEEKLWSTPVGSSGSGVKPLPVRGVIIDRNLSATELVVRAQEICTVKR
jgi:outer membrane protein assembly factor BamD